MDRYSSNDAWPEHPKQFWRETLDHARLRHWTLTYPCGHWGVLKCPTGDCVVPIFSTGNGAESVALGTRRKVDRCAHGAGQRESIAGIEDRLVKAERLVDAAAALISQQRAEVAAEMLDSADDLLDDDAAWDEFSRLLAEADELAEEAAKSFEDAGVASTSSSAALQEADRQAGAIRSDLKGERPTLRIVKDLKRRLAALRQRITSLRDL